MVKTKRRTTENPVVRLFRLDRFPLLTPQIPTSQPLPRRKQTQQPRTAKQQPGEPAPKTGFVGILDMLADPGVGGVHRGEAVGVLPTGQGTCLLYTSPSPRD